MVENTGDENDMFFEEFGVGGGGLDVLTKIFVGVSGEKVPRGAPYFWGLLHFYLQKQISSVSKMPTSFNFSCDIWKPINRFRLYFCYYVN